MKFLTVFFVLGSLCTAFGQGKFAVSVQAAPGFGHSDSKIVLPFADAATQLPTTEIVSKSNGVALSIGINMRYALSPNWSVSAGLWAGHSLYNQFQFTQNSVPSSFVTRSTPFAVGYNTPLLINFQPSRKRLSPYFSAGAVVAYRGITYIPVNNNEYISVKLGKPVTVTPLVGAGINYRTSKRTSFIVQPAFQYAIHSHPTYQYYHSYAVSLLTQFMYHF